MMIYVPNAEKVKIMLEMEIASSFFFLNFFSRICYTEAGKRTYIYGTERSK